MGARRKKSGGGGVTERGSSVIDIIIRYYTYLIPIKRARGGGGVKSYVQVIYVN